MDKGLVMFEIDAEYSIPPSNHTIFICQSVPARNVSEAIDTTISNLSRDQTRKVNVQRVQVTTARK